MLYPTELQPHIFFIISDIQSTCNRIHLHLPGTILPANSGHQTPINAIRPTPQDIE